MLVSLEMLGVGKVFTVTLMMGITMSLEDGRETQEDDEVTGKSELHS